MNPVRLLLVSATLALASAAQDLKDPLVLAPEGHRAYVRLDVARLRESELWRVLSRNLVVKGWLEGGFTQDTGLDVDELKQIQAFNENLLTHSFQENRSATLITGTANLKAATIKEAMEKRGAVRDETATYEPEQTIGGRRVWLHRTPHIPSLVELGPGTVWLAAPPDFVRARMTELTKGNPVFKPTAELEPLRLRDGGELFFACCDPQVLGGVNSLLPADAPRFTVVGLRGDLMGDVVWTATGILDDEEKAAVAVDGLRARLAEAIAGAEKQKIAFAVTWLKKIELTTKGRQVTGSLKIEQKQIAGVVTAVMALLPMMAADRGEMAEAAAEDAVRKAVESAPASRASGK